MARLHLALAKPVAHRAISFIRAGPCFIRGRCPPENSDMTFETKTEPLLPQPAFAIRMLKSIGATLIIVAFSLAMGSWGYHRFGHLDWLDSLLNAAMILTGMGPVNPMTTVAGK